MADAVLVIENHRLYPLLRLDTWLQESGLEPVVVRPYNAELLPTDLSEYQALVLLGGPQSVLDNSLTWLDPLQQLVRQALALQLPTLTVGLGTHVLAQAAGGQLGRRRQGARCGPGLAAKRDAAFADRLFETIPLMPDVIHWHADELIQLPPTAVLLAASTQAPYEAFRVGPAAWGLAFHIEADESAVARWAAHNEPCSMETDQRSAVVSATIERLDDVAEAWAPVVRHFAHG